MVKTLPPSAGEGLGLILHWEAKMFLRYDQEAKAQNQNECCSKIQ